MHSNEEYAEMGKLDDMRISKEGNDDISPERNYRGKVVKQN